MRMEEIERVINASNLDANEKAEKVNRHEVAECIFQLNKAIAFDKTEDIAPTSRFVVVDEFEIACGGIVREALEDKFSWVRDKVIIRNYKWEKSVIADEKEQKSITRNQL